MKIIGCIMVIGFFVGVFAIIAKEIGIKDTTIGLVLTLIASLWIIIGIELAGGGGPVVYVLKSLWE